MQVSLMRSSVDIADVGLHMLEVTTKAGAGPCAVAYDLHMTCMRLLPALTQFVSHGLVALCCGPDAPHGLCVAQEDCEGAVGVHLALAFGFHEEPKRNGVPDPFSVSFSPFTIWNILELRVRFD